MEAIVKEFKIQTANGDTVAVSKFFAKNPSKHTLVISSATGVLQKYYSKFALFCANNGIIVYTFDYSGIGKSISSTEELKRHTGNLKNWGQQDQAAIVSLAKKENPDTNLTLMTHSIGGQILGFNPNYDLIDKVLMVASQGGYWNDFKGLHKLKMWLFWYFLIPVSTPIFGYLPTKKLGFFENLPKNVVYEWATWGKKKEYMMQFENETYLFDEIKIPILSWSFPKDSYAPIKTVDWLVKQYKNAQITRMHYPEEKQKQPGHFGFFKSEFKELLWEQNLKWILTNSLI
ncbi:serine aminopeptidase domain-containing protein [Maribacter sp. 2308TA10-17]|uniref:alpha/beta hydrolase family protein n=1 Tax=Maribacter sp. 2308TA10-17 TaxID=3386276 RepID=UPI0039BC2C92